MSYIGFVHQTQNTEKQKMDFLSNKKGMQLGDAPNLVTTIGIVAIIGAVILLVVVGIQGSLTVGTAAANATEKGVEAITNFFDLLPVLGTVFIAVVLLGAVGFLFYAGMKRM